MNKTRKHSLDKLGRLREAFAIQNADVLRSIHSDQTSLAHCRQRPAYRLDRQPKMVGDIVTGHWKVQNIRRLIDGSARCKIQQKGGYALLRCLATKQNHLHLGGGQPTKCDRVHHFSDLTFVSCEFLDRAARKTHERYVGDRLCRE
jgi:hypothetical protein